MIAGRVVVRLAEGSMDAKSLMNEQAPSALHALLTLPLFEGGPFHRLLERMRLVGGRSLIARRIVLIVLVTWAPLVMLALAQGFALGPTRLESLLMDFAANVRFLVTVPALILAEGMCGARITAIVRQLLSAGLIDESSRPEFEANLRDSVKLSRSGTTEAILLGLAYLHSAFVLVVFLNHPVSTWRTPDIAGHRVMSMAGWWYFLAAFPFYSFLLARWLWRLGLWWQLLWRASASRAALSPAHPDGAAGLGFLSTSLSGFSLFVFGAAAMTAAGLADLVVYEGASPLDYQWYLAEFLVFILMIIAGPLLFFIPRLSEAKDQALLRYGGFASRQIQDLEQKWLREKGAGAGETGRASQDFSTVSDFGSGPRARDEIDSDRAVRCHRVARDRVASVPAAVRGTYSYWGDVLASPESSRVSQSLPSHAGPYL